MKEKIFMAVLDFSNDSSKFYFAHVIIAKNSEQVINKINQLFPEMGVEKIICTLDINDKIFHTKDWLKLHYENFCNVAGTIFTVGYNDYVNCRMVRKLKELDCYLQRTDQEYKSYLLPKWRCEVYEAFTPIRLK